MIDIKLHLGNCIDIMKDIPDSSIDEIITSPPYWNIKEYSHWYTYEEYLIFVDMCISECARIIKPGRYICWNIQSFLHSKVNGERYHYPISCNTINIAYKYDLMLEILIIWHKPNGRNQRMFGSYPYPPTIIYTTNYEDILILRKKGKANLNNKNTDSILTSKEWSEWTLPIWTIPIDYKKRGHPAQFPVELPRRCIKLHSFCGDTILDPFVGSGTTAVACIETGRNFIGIEKDEKYFSIAKNRIEQEQNKQSMNLFATL